MRNSQRGVALVIVLAVVVMVTILVVLLVTTMRMDREASFYNIERTRADFMAREGVETARALIVGATTNATSFWVSQPGQITTVGNPPGTNLLFSGTGIAGNSNSVSINRQSWIATNDFALDPGNPSTTNTNNYLLTWIYLNKDGTRSTTMTTNTIGRYAFWTDDDSTRIDLNTAWERMAGGNTATTMAHPSQVSLGALSNMAPWATIIRNYAATNFFNTPFDALAVDPAITNALFGNRFYLTHYTQDPDLNPWGQGKIVLTTKSASANGRNYLNILGTTNTDPGLIANISPGMLYTNALTSLVGSGSASLLRADWPYVTNSFGLKYGTNRAVQMAIDIVEYVRSAESSNTFIQPIVGTPTMGGSGLSGITLLTTNSVTNIPSGAIIGTVRRPMITQMGVSVPATTNAGGVYPSTVYTELYLPTNYWTGPTTCYLLTSISSDGATVTNTGLQGPYTITPPFQEITQTNFPVLPNATTNRPGSIYVRIVALGTNVDSVTNMLDAAPLSSSTITNFISIPVPTTNISSVGVNDPRVNKFSADWQTVSTNSTTWSSIATYPSIWMADTGVTPPQDTTALGGTTISDASLYMPVAGGAVGSVGELGYISTGAGTNGVPWRTVRLQPTPNGSTNTIPDWALLDLFAAPIPAPITNFVPATNEIAGRININAAIEPFTNVFRTNVLAALFTNVYTTAATNAFVPVANVITNVLNRSTAVDGVLYGNTNVYVSPGELAEISGIADSGEASEAVMRQVASLTTVRGDVFTVYSIGQALQRTPSGTFKINGQKMLQVTIERYLNGASPSYRVVYWREIEP